MGEPDLETEAILASDVPHPFNCYPSTTELKVSAFARIHGTGPYEKYSWAPDGSDFGVDIENGIAESIEASCELFDNEDTITLVLQQQHSGYRYPKSHFQLILKHARSHAIHSELVDRYGSQLASGFSLALLPVSRLQLEDCEIQYPGGVTFYQQGEVDLEALNCISNNDLDDVFSKSPALSEDVKIAQYEGRSLTNAMSSVTGVTLDAFAEHTLVALPWKINWSDLGSMSHKQHMDFLEKISEKIDRECFDYVVYRQCEFYPPDSLPGRAGSLDTSPMFEAVLLYDPETNTSQIISGSVFSHAVMKGIGLLLYPIDPIEFPGDGEMGRIAKHALALYKEVLHSSSDTSRFVQAMSLLEFLAFPDDYRPFKMVKKIVASHAASSEYEYKSILDRFLELTGKKDPDTNQFIGYRTRIVHLGERIEDIIPIEADRKALFHEIYKYIKSMVDHMITHSDLSFERYRDVRKELAARFSV